ncbi:hypothetical protein [Amycolatopsis samaneae]|uniref:Uncharacterized protein n=1 Tax=Amycolatopsis samaneae TaxID=664691 RepID=A0ABW5GJ69_9PSEU
MFWLFGQIWLWLLLAFLLGALVTWLVMRAAQRREAPEPYAEHEPYPEHEPEPVHEPEPHAAEETQYIPQAAYDDEHPEDHAHPYARHEHADDEPRYPDEEPYDPEPEGHRQGQLPTPAPQTQRHAADDPAWPADDAWPADSPEHPAPEDPSARSHQPGRGG